MLGPRSMPQVLRFAGKGLILLKSWKKILISYHYYLSYYRIIVLSSLLKRNSAIEHTRLQSATAEGRNIEFPKMNVKNENEEAFIFLGHVYDIPI